MPLPPQPPLPTPAQERKLAFAVIGGNRYTAFYDYTIMPHAVVVGKTVYCAWQNEFGQPFVAAYNMMDKTWDGPVQASDYGLIDDNHGKPSIYADSKGYLHLFYGCHGGAMRHTRSRLPHNIERWDEQPSLAPQATYPQSMRLSGRMVLFYRSGNTHREPWVLQTSTDDGRTWSEPEKIIEMRLDPPDERAAAYCYSMTGSDNKTMHLFWLHKDDNASLVNRGVIEEHPWRPLKYKHMRESAYRYNIYYARREPAGTWRTASGEKLQIPISKTVADTKCLVYDSGDEFISVARMAVDKKNQPYIRFKTGVTDPRNNIVIVPVVHKYANFAGGRWHVADKIPDHWPTEARRIIRAYGMAAYGGTGWFTRQKFLEGGGTAIYLYHDIIGYAPFEH